MGALPGILAEYRGCAALTGLSSLSIAGDSVSGTRVDHRGSYEIQAAVPAVVSVTDMADKPRFANFKGLAAAKKATIARLSLADIGVTAEQVGLGHAATAVTAAVPRPERTQGEVIGSANAAAQIADFLAAENLI